MSPKDLDNSNYPNSVKTVNRKMSKKLQREMPDFKNVKITISLAYYQSQISYYASIKRGKLFKKKQGISL